ncbi:SpoIIE family protein phosphatase [Streptomyces sp. 110]|uniref:SpoIIE family protein phosphatase n=1 Tax=Streptomyces endocoffeicus TaxID=2898945 RepID=A0ABS1PKY3_9ACTN|nr:SpoIIE family protein phosphatase [Streptomyces endocoffeicus]MBL1112934.1 SpoIIE family protein phosphatase [Streptomyces endocoffeicus]
MAAAAAAPGGRNDETFMSLAFAQSPDALALCDTDLWLVRTNAEMARVLGLSEDRTRGLPVSEIVRPGEGDMAVAVMRQARESGVAQRFEASPRTPDGSPRHFWSVSAIPLKDREGRVRGVFLTARDSTEQHRARQRLLLINEASTGIGSTLDITRTTQELVDVLVPSLGDFTCVDSLVALEGGEEPGPGTLSGAITMRRRAQRSIIDEEPMVDVGTMATYPEFTPAAESLAAGRGIIYEVTDAAFDRWAAYDPPRAERARAYGTHSVMAVPMRARGVTLGVVVVTRHRRPEPFGPDDLLLAEEIIGRAAVCVDNARRYTRERGTAIALQRSLLPRRLPCQSAVEVASRYLPAGELTGVGGDWFDVIPLSGARVALVVGDVVGHGIHASAGMGRLRTAVRTLADIDLPPDELLTHLDDLVTRVPEAAADAEAGEGADDDGGTGATCLYAVYDPVSRRCCLARAGHPPPAVVAPDGTVDFIDLPVAPPLGLGELPYESTEVELAEGSLLALYTNGLLGARSRDLDKGLDALRNALTRPAEPLDDLCDTVLEDLVPDRPADDIALLIARLRALDADRVASWDLPPDPSVVATVRGEVAARLAAWGLDEAVFTTELVVSELVTNAVRHARTPLRLKVIHDRGLICEVTDGSITAPHLRRARTFDEGGRGLFLVAQLAQRWGTRYTRDGKTIWAEQFLPTG